MIWRDMVSIDRTVRFLFWTRERGKLNKKNVLELSEL